MAAASKRPLEVNTIEGAYSLLREEEPEECADGPTGMTFILGSGPTEKDAKDAVEKLAKAMLKKLDKKCKECTCEEGDCRSEGWLLGEPAVQEQTGKEGLMHKLKLPKTFTALQVLLYGCYCVKEG